jgi:hypothetical protein
MHYNFARCGKSVGISLCDQDSNPLIRINALDFVDRKENRNVAKHREVSYEGLGLCSEVGFDYKGLNETKERAAIGDRPLSILPLVVNTIACEFLASKPKTGKH